MNFTSAFTLSITDTAPGCIPRKRKSFLDSQIENLQTFKIYTKILGVTRNSEESKPKREWRANKTGDIGLKENIKD